MYLCGSLAIVTILRYDWAMTTKDKNLIPDHDNSRRDNEAVKKRIAEIIKRKEEALKKALKMVTEAQHDLYFRHSSIAAEIYGRATSAMLEAEHEIAHAIRFNYSNDTYLGNLACGPLGAAVLRDIEIESKVE